jgi:hypothetical protein
MIYLVLTRAQEEKLVILGTLAEGSISGLKRELDNVREEKESEKVDGGCIQYIKITLQIHTWLQTSIRYEYVQKR